MQRVQVKFEVELPETEREPTWKEVEEWLRFEFRDNGSMKIANPLSSHEPEPVFGSFDWNYR